MSTLETIPEGNKARNMVKDYSTLVKKAYQDAGSKYAASPQQHSRGRDSQLAALNSSQDVPKSRS